MLRRVLCTTVEFNAYKGVFKSIVSLTVSMHGLREGMSLGMFSAYYQHF